MTSCHNLELLSIAGVSGVDDTLLVSIAENCPRLRIINLKGCKQVELPWPVLGGGGGRVT